MYYIYIYIYIYIYVYYDLYLLDRVFVQIQRREEGNISTDLRTGVRRMGGESFRVYIS